MIQSRENKEISTVFKKSIISLYLGLMLLLYLGYILLENYRLIKAEQWIKTIYLTQEDLQNIHQLGFWNSVLEVSFSFLMLIATFILFRYKKDRRSFINFIIVHLFLFTAILLLGFILSFFLKPPIGNLTQPLLLATFLLVLIVIIRLIKKLKKRRSKSADTL